MRGLITLLTIVLVSCGNGSSTCTAGSEGCECTLSGLCDSPLLCVSGVCVAETADTGTDTAVDTAADTPTSDTPVETQCTTPADCDDDDPCTTDTCNEYGDCEHGPVDEDGDGFPAIEVGMMGCDGVDCDDTDDSVYPGATEGCDIGDDFNCDGLQDNDHDLDGHIGEDACPATGDDCCDTSEAHHPGADWTDAEPPCCEDPCSPEEQWDVNCDGVLEFELNYEGAGCFPDPPGSPTTCIHAPGYVELGIFCSEQGDYLIGCPSPPDCDPTGLEEYWEFRTQRCR